MLCETREPTLREALSDPIIQAVMRADGVDPARLETDLKRIAVRIIRSPAAEGRTSVR